MHVANKTKQEKDPIQVWCKTIEVSNISRARFLETAISQNEVMKDGYKTSYRQVVSSPLKIFQVHPSL